MMRYFKNGVKIDSGFNIKYNGDTVLFYKYYDENSQFIFSLNNYSKRKFDFDIAVFQLSSDILKLKNDIEYGMNRKELFDAIKYNKVDCDTVDIHYGFIGYYFRFVFQDNILIQVSKEYIH